MRICLSGGLSLGMKPDMLGTMVQFAFLSSHLYGLRKAQDHLKLLAWPCTALWMLSLVVLLTHSEAKAGRL